jgi:phage FluMu protein Com
MPIELTCPGCAKTLRLAEEHAGKTGKCPSCEMLFQIPTPSAPPPSAPPTIAPLSLPPFGGQASAPTPTLKQAWSRESNSGSPPNLFGESAQAGASPFADAVNQIDTPNPYAAPSTASPYAAGQTSNSSAQTATVLGAISIGASVMSFCCCIGFLASVGCSIVGLILTFQAPRQERTLPLVLNLIGLFIPLLWFAVVVLLQIVAAQNRAAF